MLFTLKKFVSWFLDPANICLLLIAPSVVLIWSKRYLHLGRRLMTAGLLVFAIFSNGIVARRLVLGLEATYSPVADVITKDELSNDLLAVKYIAVLSGGGSDTPGLSANNRLSRPALARIMEGVRLARLLPQTTLMLTGSGHDAQIADAQLMETCAQSLGVEPHRIVRIDTPRDTKEEISCIKKEVGTARIAIVSSATHLPRVARLAAAGGIQPQLVPTDFMVRRSQHRQWYDYLWSLSSLQASAVAVHEWLGIAVARLTSS